MHKTITQILGGVLILSGLSACSDAPNETLVQTPSAQYAAPIDPPTDTLGGPGQIIAPGSNIGVAPPGPPH